MISKAQAEVLRRMRDGDALEWHRGNAMAPEHSMWQSTYTSVNQTTMSALQRRRFIRLRGKGASETYNFWELTDTGRKALTEYEQQTCDVATGESNDH